MKSKLEKLREAINGKQIKYEESHYPDEIMFDAILLCPPGGDKVSVKPIGTTPEEILKAHEGRVGFQHFDLEHVSRKEFCFSTHGVHEANIEILSALAEIPQGGVYNFVSICGESPWSASPSCPY